MFYIIPLIDYCYQSIKEIFRTKPMHSIVFLLEFKTNA